METVITDFEKRDMQKDLSADGTIKMKTQTPWKSTRQVLFCSFLCCFSTTERRTTTEVQPTAFVIGFSQFELPSLGESTHLKNNPFPILLLSPSGKTHIDGQSDRQKVTTLRSEHRMQIKCLHSLTSSTSNYHQISTFTKLVLLHLMPHQNQQWTQHKQH